MYIPKFMFTDLFKDLNSTWTASTHDYDNAIVHRHEDSYEMKLAVPGLSKEDLKVEIDPSELRMTIEYAGEATDFVDTFKRAYTLPTDVNIEAIKADVVNGVLSLEMPKGKKTNKMTLL